MKALIVVPARNEQACVGDVVRTIIAAGHPCVVIDYASTDRTASPRTFML